MTKLELFPGANMGFPKAPRGADADLVQTELIHLTSGRLRESYLRADGEGTGIFCPFSISGCFAIPSLGLAGNGKFQ